MQVTYYAYDDGSHFGSEVYSGKNYVLGSTKPSYSRNYKSFKHLPKEWKPIVFDLVEKAGKVKWSTFVGKGHTFEA